jgi:hypothetical protein
MVFYGDLSDTLCASALPIEYQHWEGAGQWSSVEDEHREIGHSARRVVFRGENPNEFVAQASAAESRERVPQTVAGGRVRFVPDLLANQRVSGKVAGLDSRGVGQAGSSTRRCAVSPEWNLVCAESRVTQSSSTEARVLNPSVHGSPGEPDPATPVEVMGLPALAPLASPPPSEPPV